MVSAKVANGKVSTVSYTDDYGDGANPGGGTSGTNGATYANATLLTSPVPNTSEAAHVAKAQFDFSSGQLTGFRDRNNIVTQTIYNDAFNRPTLVKTAVGTPFERHAANYYAQAIAQTIYGVTLERGDALTTTDLFAVDDGLAKSWVKTDGFGRTLEAWSKSSDGDLKAQTVYDGLGRAKKATNPYRPTLNEPIYWTESFYDLAGRTVKVKTPDNAEVNTSYAGNTVNWKRMFLYAFAIVTIAFSAMQLDFPKVSAAICCSFGNECGRLTCCDPRVSERPCSSGATGYCRRCCFVCPD